MHFTTFVSDTPIPHLQRALDEVERCGFDLCAVTLVQGQTGAEVRIEFQPVGVVGAHTVVARIARIPAIQAVKGGSVVVETIGVKDHGTERSDR